MSQSSLERKATVIWERGVDAYIRDVNAVSAWKKARNFIWIYWDLRVVGDFVRMFNWDRPVFANEGHLNIIINNKESNHTITLVIIFETQDMDAFLKFIGNVSS
jgi:hypothetical protein